MRLHAVGRHGETPGYAVAGRRYGEGIGQLRLQRGHELRGVEPEHPLGNRAQVARVEGQLRGVQKLIAKAIEPADCDAIAQQMSAARKALDRSFVNLLTSAMVTHSANADSTDEALASAKHLAKFLDKYI